MSSDAFIISTARNADPSSAIQEAINSASLDPSRIQDLIWGLDGTPLSSEVEEISIDAGLACPSVRVASSLRAIFFAAESILAGDVELVLVAGIDGKSCSALVLASPEAVGRLNLLPRARLAARSLNGRDSALRSAGIASGDVALARTGANAASLVVELLESLESAQAKWGMIAAENTVLLVERI
jgi:acetyl-CoA acetyltransferase